MDRIGIIQECMQVPSGTHKSIKYIDPSKRTGRQTAGMNSKIAQPSEISFDLIFYVVWGTEW